ncbi:MAG: MFS transporter [Syntrophorhabdales bacterium]|jgi:MFS family permease
MKYYQKLTILLGLIWGFIAIQRIVIAIIMPAIQADMKFTYTDVGMIISITGLIWAFGTIIWASIGDTYGRRPVIVFCGILASIFSWMTGMVGSLGQMLAVRGVLGFFEGGPWGPAVATVAEEAPPEKRGGLVGLIPGAFMLIGVCLGPIIAVQILQKMGWRSVFYIISIPGIILAIIAALFMHEPASVAAGIKARKSGQKRVVMQQGHKVKLSDVLKYKNVIVSTVNSVPVMAWLWIYSGFSALFLAKVHHLPMEAIGLAMAASGLGGFVGMVVMGRLSDGIGRKTAIILSGLLCCLSGLSIIALPVGSPLVLFCVLFFFWGMFGGASFPLYLGTLPTEAVPPEFAGTAVGVPTAVGEIIGAAVMPTIAGALADAFSLYAPMWMAAIAGLVIMLVSLGYVETAPGKLAKMAKKPTHDDHLLRPFRGKEPAVAPEG